MPEPEAVEPMTKQMWPAHTWEEVEDLLEIIAGWGNTGGVVGHQEVLSIIALARQERERAEALERGQLAPITADRTGHLYRCAKINGVWSCAEGCAVKRAERAEESKDGAYKERDRLVAALSCIFPASLERHTDEDKEWDNDWRWIVYIDSPVGQLSWHIHDSELPLFNHLKRCVGTRWDGHSTEEKYERLARIPCSGDHPCHGK